MDITIKMYFYYINILTRLHGICTLDVVKELNFGEIVQKALSRRSMPSPKKRRTIRKKAGLTQEDVARPLGVDAATVCRWEAGGSSPRGASFDAYLRLLETLQREVLA
jgi:DNA-binding transcriptional regulator YiaG